MVTSFVDDPALVTSAQMDRWCRDFDNWGICDTVCFHLFDRTPHAWRKVAKWHDRREEFVKRAAFALLASLALHDKTADDAVLSRQPAAHRARRRRRTQLRQEGRELGPARGRQAQPRAERRRADSGAAPGVLTDAAPRWVGKDALRELTSAAVIRQLAARPRAAKPAAASRRRQGRSA